MANRVIHLFNGFLNPNGGSELEALTLAHQLRAHREVRLWATSSRSPASLREQHGIQRAGFKQTCRGGGPNGGTYVFIGAHWRNKLWPYLVPTPERLIYVFNTFHPKILSLTSQHPRLLRWPRTEYVFISEFQKMMLDTPGEVHPSPIDIGHFTPANAAASAARQRPVIGRMSRDNPVKHDVEDLALYGEWSTGAAHVKLQGATCLAGQIEAGAHLELLPEGAGPAVDFLRSLDIFYYRTGSHVETFGRVVFEAMACGLPVVCHRHGGYADSIRHGENGFLFDTTDEARDIVRTLIVEPALRARIGANARRTVEALYSHSALAHRAQFYLDHAMTRERDQRK